MFEAKSIKEKGLKKPPGFPAAPNSCVFVVVVVFLLLFCMDLLLLRYSVLKEIMNKKNVKTKGENGCYLEGCFPVDGVTTLVSFFSSTSWKRVFCYDENISFTLTIVDIVKKNCFFFFLFFCLPPLSYISCWYVRKTRKKFICSFFFVFFFLFFFFLLIYWF